MEKLTDGYGFGVSTLSKGGRCPWGLVALPCRDVTVLGRVPQALLLSTHPTQPQCRTGAITPRAVHWHLQSHRHRHCTVSLPSPPSCPRENTCKNLHVQFIP